MNIWLSKKFLLYGNKLSNKNTWGTFIFMFNPLPTIVANVIHIDPLFFVCTLQPNRPTHGDVPRQGDKTCFFAKKWVCFRAASPTKSVKLAPKWCRNFYFFPFFNKVTFCHFFRLFKHPVTFGCGLDDTLGVVFAENTPSSGVGGSMM